MGKDAFLNKSQASNVVLIPCILHFKYVPRHDVFVVKIHRLSVSRGDLWELIQICTTNDHHILLELSKDSVIEIWVVSLLVKSLNFLPHFFIFFVISLFLFDYACLSLHVFERGTD